MTLTEHVRSPEPVKLNTPPPSMIALPTPTPTPASAGASRVDTTAVPDAASPTMQAPPQAITQAPQPPDPFAEPTATPPDDLRRRSLKSAAAIDKQLRKEAWNPRDKMIANDTTVLAAKIAGAYVGNDGVMSTKQITMPDGRLMTKVRTPGGSFCAYKESNALTGGRDPFRDGIRTLVTNCPR
jgi:hypothetical protein